MTDRIKSLLAVKEKFQDLPFEAILKTAVLRSGLNFNSESLKFCTDSKTKSYFIFSFDHVAQKNLSDLQKHAAPEEIALTGGPFDVQRTIVSVRLNPLSPFEVRLNEKKDRLILTLSHEKIADITTEKKPGYYTQALKNGKPVSDIAPTIEWGYLIYLTAFRLCQYWGKSEECQFCDINENYRQQKKERSYTGVKSMDEVIEALHIISENDPEKKSRAYTVTGGSITSELNGLKEADFYAQYARVIEKNFPGRWTGKAVVQALPVPEAEKLKNAGFQIYHPNYEVWDKKLFTQICPGKESYVGYNEWIKRILDSASIFGPQNVIPNFVAGVEMAKPHGFANVEDAIASTQEGLDFFMSQKICPRFTLWCPEPLTVLGAGNDAPPLEYFLRLLQVYRDTHKKYRLPVPPGYGSAGVGKAVFSVSAFMDVL